tara:strand:+ start:64 stop:1140 length:1077 start_codon:yes stop_codon:yes gene_type:complete
MYVIKNKINNYLYFFFLLLILIFIKFSTIKAFGDNYTVKNINIKEQYDTNFNKSQVINKGFEKAFKTLIYKIVENKDKNLFKDTPKNKIRSLIDNFSITNEKFINNNYEVDFEVRFDKKKLFSFIRSKNVISSVPKNAEVLIIPILIDTQSNELEYFDQNYFYNNWNKKNKKYFLLNYNLPDQNIENFRLFQKIKNNLENDDLSEITDIYNFKNIFIITFYKNKNNLRIFSKISFSNFNFNLNINQNIIDYDDNKVLDRIILNLKHIYEDKWKLINKINTSIIIPIKISVKNNDYIITDKLENLLNKSDFVYKYKIEKINSKEIIYRIIYNSNPDKFINSLKVNGIDINSSGDIWKIK